MADDSRCCPTCGSACEVCLEAELTECTRCNSEEYESDLVTVGDWKLCSICVEDI